MLVESGDDHDHWFWFWRPWRGHGHDKDNGCDDSTDPSIRINPGGKSDPFPNSFQAINGGGIFDYQNDSGKTIDEILFTTTFVPGDPYTCYADPTLFSTCGFKIEGNQLDILFYGGPGIPPATTVPEPASFVLLFGCAAVTAIRLRSRRRRV